MKCPDRQVKFLYIIYFIINIVKATAFCCQAGFGPPEIHSLTIYRVVECYFADDLTRQKAVQEQQFFKIEACEKITADIYLGIGNK